MFESGEELNADVLDDDEDAAENDDDEDELDEDQEEDGDLGVDDDDDDVRDFGGGKVASFLSKGMLHGLSTLCPSAFGGSGEGAAFFV